jgi:DNA-binding response OmpR family regulator
MKGPAAATPFPEARILVVDDEEQVRSGLRRFLDLLGYRADEAASGQEALQMLQHTPYDVAVLDIRMPGMDGIEVMHRALQMCPDLAIIFLTGHATLESAIAAVKSHAADYLRKPVSMGDLATAITSALQLRAQEERPRTHAPDRFLRAGSVTLDLKKRLAFVKEPGAADGFSATLTPIQTALLAHLMRHPGAAVPCYELAQAAVNYEVSEEEAPSIVRPHICRLQKKIEPDPTRPRLILTVAGKCYLFDL